MISLSSGRYCPKNKKYACTSREVTVFITKRYNFIFMHGYCQVTLVMYNNNYIHKMCLLYVCVYCVCSLHFNNIPNIPDDLVFGGC